MQRMIDAIVSALTAADFSAEKSVHDGAFGKLAGAKIAVGVKSARQEGSSRYVYLGMRQVQNEILPYYGRSLAATVFFRVYAPRRLTSEECLDEADNLADFLAQGISAVKLDKITVGECRYDEKSDCFVCELTAEASALIYATADENETEFTDFILKGEAQ